MTLDLFFLSNALPLQVRGPSRLPAGPPSSPRPDSLSSNDKDGLLKMEPLNNAPPAPLYVPSPPQKSPFPPPPGGTTFSM